MQDAGGGECQPWTKKVTSHADLPVLNDAPATDAAGDEDRTIKGGDNDYLSMVDNEHFRHKS